MGCDYGMFGRTVRKKGDVKGGGRRVRGTKGRVGLGETKCRGEETRME